MGFWLEGQIFFVHFSDLAKKWHFFWLCQKMTLFWHGENSTLFIDMVKIQLFLLTCHFTTTIFHHILVPTRWTLWTVSEPSVPLSDPPHFCCFLSSHHSLGTCQSTTQCLLASLGPIYRNTMGVTSCRVFCATLMPPVESNAVIAIPQDSYPMLN